MLCDPTPVRELLIGNSRWVGSWESLPGVWRGVEVELLGAVPVLESMGCPRD